MLLDVLTVQDDDLLDHLLVFKTWFFQIFCVHCLFLSSFSLPFREGLGVGPQISSKLFRWCFHPTPALLRLRITKKRLLSTNQIGKSRRWVCSVFTMNQVLHRSHRFFTIPLASHTTFPHAGQRTSYKTIIASIDSLSKFWKVVVAIMVGLCYTIVALG